MEKKQKTVKKSSNLVTKRFEFYLGYITLRKIAFSFGYILKLSYSYSNYYFYLISDTSRTLAVFYSIYCPSPYVVVAIHFGSMSTSNSRKQWN